MIDARAAGLTRLARDTRGNTLALMAAAMIPMAAMAGSAVDAARMYVVKVRLQQACDAGVLAGRKFMVSSSSTTLDTTATTQARSFFDNNFRRGWMQTSDIQFTPSKTADQQVAGVAQARVPMTVMKMFAAPDVTLKVACEARFDVADADIMMVLDLTGSMACAANEASCSQAVTTYTRPDGTLGYATSEKASSKIRALRASVLNFYDTLVNNADPTTNIRYGFVPYTSTVNAGLAVSELSRDFIVDRWTYQSRSIVGDADRAAATEQTVANISQSDCNGRAGRTPTAALTYTANGEAEQRTVTWTKNSNNANGSCVVRTQPLKPMWRYQPVEYDVSRFKRFDLVLDPSKITGARTRWQGCLEERDTRADASFTQSNLPPDLDPDLAPTNDDTRWRPMWPEVVYYRGNRTSVDFAGNSATPQGDYRPRVGQDGATTAFTNLTPNADPAWDRNIALGYVSCGKPVQRLRRMTRDEVDDYLTDDDFVAMGGTYHDTGMIWGTRMIAPNGPFRADTAAWPGRNAPNRFIVFMTDGDMSPNACLYGMYGMENYDRRVTGGAYAANCLIGNAEARHNARFLAECEAARSRNIRVFVVAFGQTLTPELTACASPGQAYFAGDNDALDAAFGNIARQVAMLRVSK